ncbi:MAG: hypothetical protein QGG48_09680 [Desulfatiglandales bacterium]|nr:hypothetical protein [Desulfatiglandales bacterium]
MANQATKAMARKMLGPVWGSEAIKESGKAEAFIKKITSPRALRKEIESSQYGEVAVLKTDKGLFSLDAGKGQHQDIEMALDIFQNPSNEHLRFISEDSMDILKEAFK